MNNLFKKCPFCDESIRQDAKICHFCGEMQPTTVSKRHDNSRPTSSISQNGPSTATAPKPPKNNRVFISIIAAAVICFVIAGAFVAYKFFLKRKTMDCNSPEVITEIEKSLYNDAFKSNVRTGVVLMDKRLGENLRFDDNVKVSILEAETTNNSESSNTLSCRSRVSIHLSDELWEGIYKFSKTIANQTSFTELINATTDLEHLKQIYAKELHAEIAGNDLTSKEKTFFYTIRKFDTNDIGVEIKRGSDEKLPYMLGFTRDKVTTNLLIMAIQSNLYLELLERSPEKFALINKYPKISDNSVPSNNTEPRSTASEDVPSYASVKIKQGPANSRFAAAWRMIPQPTRNRLQQSISYLPKQLEQKCRRFANAYPAGSNPHKAAYLQCQIAHENIISQGLEKFASAYQSNSNANFNSYVNPDNIISRQDWSTYY